MHTPALVRPPDSTASQLLYQQYTLVAWVQSAPAHQGAPNEEFTYNTVSTSPVSQPPLGDARQHGPAMQANMAGAC